LQFHVALLIRPPPLPKVLAVDDGDGGECRIEIVEETVHASEPANSRST
jgi:hypothetical protein